MLGILRGLRGKTYIEKKTRFFKNESKNQKNRINTGKIFKVS
jgi:hypothetical protein